MFKQSKNVKLAYREWQGWGAACTALGKPCLSSGLLKLKKLIEPCLIFLFFTSEWYQQNTLFCSLLKIKLRNLNSFLLGIQSMFIKHQFNRCKPCPPHNRKQSQLSFCNMRLFACLRTRIIFLMAVVFMLTLIEPTTYNYLYRFIKMSQRQLKDKLCNIR